MDELYYEGWDAIERAWREGLTPDPLLTVSEWSDRHRMLSSKASAEPGRWRTSRTPYLKAIMDCLSPTSPVERVVFMKAAQLGATEMGSNWIGYVIHHAPGPMMAVWPTVEMAKRNSKQRIDPLIEESSALAELIAPARSRDSGNTILAKEFRGGVLVMTGANSAVGLRSMPVRYLFLDEVDGYPLDVEGEGDAISLAEARTRTFARRKIFIVSTPTISGASAIEREYEASDQRRYFVPCPHCSHRQWLRFEQLRWDKGQPETAAYICESCDTAIAEHHKTWMLEHGEWRAMITDGAGKTAGFHLSSLYSPVGWRSWREIAAAWEAAVSKESGSAAAIKTFKNTELGETWVEEGEAPDWQRLYDRRERWTSGTVPAGGLFLTAGADVQKDRIEVDVWAWGRGLESWLVDHFVIPGGPDDPAAWDKLTALLGRGWQHANDEQNPVSALAGLERDTGVRLSDDRSKKAQSEQQFCNRDHQQEETDEAHQTGNVLNQPDLARRRNTVRLSGFERHIHKIQNVFFCGKRIVRTGVRAALEEIGRAQRSRFAGVDRFHVETNAHWIRWVVDRLSPGLQRLG